jgi:hypothetical protein
MENAVMKASREDRSQSALKHLQAFESAGRCDACGIGRKAVTLTVSGVILVECRKCADKRRGRP